MADLTSTKTAKDKSVDFDRIVAQVDQVPLAFEAHGDILGLQHSAGNQAVNRLLQADSSAAAQDAKDASSIVQDVLQNGSGQPLDTATRAEMGARFGADFGQVRIFADSAASSSAEELDSEAFTIAQDITFGSGKYQPATTSGKQLLAHELAHVVQQSSAGPLATSTALSLGLTNSQAEAAADRASDVVIRQGGDQAFDAGRLAQQAPVNTPQLQRKPAVTPQKKPHPIPSEMRTQMNADIDFIVIKLRQRYLSDEDDLQIIEIVRKYWEADQTANGSNASFESGFLDEFVRKLKGRAFSNWTISSMGQQQYQLVYDALWHALDEPALSEFRLLITQTAEASAPQDKPENAWETIGKQEAIGGWGILKGMGAGLVGMASPIAAEEIGKSFDESGEILFGKEWSEGEDLDLGLGIHMNARQIGTAGGNVIMQLALMGKGGTSASFAKAQKVLGVASSLQGIGMAANQIAEMVAQMQKDGTLTIENLVKNPDFLSQITTLIVSIYGAVTGVSTSGNKALQARIQMMLQSAQILPEFGKIIQIQNSNESLKSKRQKIGEVIGNVIGQVVGILISGAQYHQEHGKGASSKKDASKVTGEQLSPTPKNEPVTAQIIEPVNPSTPISEMVPGLAVEGDRRTGLYQQMGMAAAQTQPSAGPAPEAHIVVPAVPAESQTMPTPLVPNHEVRPLETGSTSDTTTLSEVKMPATNSSTESGLELDTSGRWQQNVPDEIYGMIPDEQVMAETTPLDQQIAADNVLNHQELLTNAQMEANARVNAPENERAVGSPGTALHGESESRSGMNLREYNPAEVALSLRNNYSPEYGGYIRSVEFEVPERVGNFGTRSDRFSQDEHLQSIGVEHPAHEDLTNTQSERGHAAAQQLSGGDPDVAAALMVTTNTWPMTGRGPTGVNQGAYKNFENAYIALKADNPGSSVHIRVEAVVGNPPSFVQSPHGNPVLSPDAFNITVTFTPNSGGNPPMVVNFQIPN